jgi:hypothetical protein
MINLNQVETILKINGAASSSPDEEIRSILLNARYNKDEVDTALMILRENVKTKQTRVEGLHKIFRSDEALQPDEISSLLGIDMEVDQIRSSQRANNISGVQHAVVWFLSLIVAVSGIMLYMYANEFGIFHPSVGLAIFHAY